MMNNQPVPDQLLPVRARVDDEFFLAGEVIFWVTHVWQSISHIDPKGVRIAYETWRP